jgi:hypothetical protein
MEQRCQQVCIACSENGLRKHLLYVHYIGILTTDWTTGADPRQGQWSFPLTSVSRPALKIHPASYSVGTVGPFPGVKRGLDVTLTTHPRLVPRSVVSRSYIPLLLDACMAVAGQLYLFYFIVYRNSYGRIIEDLQKCSKPHGT